MSGLGEILKDIYGEFPTDTQQMTMQQTHERLCAQRPDDPNRVKELEKLVGWEGQGETLKLYPRHIGQTYQEYLEEMYIHALNFQALGLTPRLDRLE